MATANGRVIAAGAVRTPEELAKQMPLQMWLDTISKTAGEVVDWQVEIPEWGQPQGFTLTLTWKADTPSSIKPPHAKQEAHTG